MRRKFLGALAAIAATLPRPAGADPIDLAQVEDVEDLALADLLEVPVVAASRYEQAPGDSPTLVSTVDAEQIERFGYRSVGDALRGVRGVYVSSDRNYSYLGVRGVSVPGDYNTRLALSIDGHRMNDAVYGQALTGPELGLPMIAIDRIEVIRGSAWSVYGHSALLGAVQIVTATGASRPGLRVQATTRATAETSGDPAGRSAVAWRGEELAASYGAVTGGVDVFAAASYLFDPGLGAIYTADFADPSLTCVDEEARPRPCDGIARNADDEEAGSAYVVVRSRTLSLHGLASRRRKRVPTASFGTVIGDPGLQTFDDRFYADAEYHRERDRSDVIARVAADAYRFLGDYPYDFPRPGYESLPESRVSDREYAGGVWFSSELRGRYKWPRLGSHLSELEIAGGGEFGLGYAHQAATLRYPEGDEPQLDRTDRDRLVAVSAQASGRAFGRVVGFAAIRADYLPDSFGLTVNPQGGVVLDGGDAGRLRASVARGFRAPNAYERSYDWADQHANPDLGPERSKTMELSYERYLGAHVRAQVVAYRQELTDLIALVVRDDGERGFDNAGSIDGEGVEAELEGRWGGLRLRTTYSRQWSTDGAGARLVNSPRSLAYASVLTPIAGGRAALAVETSYIGSRRASSGDTVAAAFIGNLAITVPHVTGALDLTVGVTNLLDTRGGDPGSEDHLQGMIPRDPRTLWLRLQLGLGR